MKAQALQIAADLLQPTLDDERFNGSRVLKDGIKVRQVAGLTLLGCSGREIERQTGVDRRLHDMCVEQARRNGWIPALRDEMESLVGSNAVKSQRALSVVLTRVQDGEITSEIGSVLKGAAVAAKEMVLLNQLLTGQATEIVEVRSGPTKEEMERFLRESSLEVQAVASLKVAGSDVESGGKREFVGISGEVAELGTELGTEKAGEVGGIEAGGAERMEAGQEGGGDRLPGGVAKVTMQQGQ